MNKRRRHLAKRRRAARGICGRCYDAGPVYPPACAERPEALAGQPIGMYHCPDCGAMLLAGVPHWPLCRRCQTRTHPAFDRPDERRPAPRPLSNRV